MGEYTPNIVSGEEKRGFWAMVTEDGTVQLGSTDTGDIIMEWRDPDPFYPMYVGFMTGWGASGEWNACNVGIQIYGSHLQIGIILM